MDTKLILEDNPLYKFRFCPICGSEHFDEHAYNARKCRDCGFTYYTNPRAATVALIVNDHDELLVATRANEPAKGTLDLVGGFADLYETIEEAMCREIQEECGLTIDPGQLQFLFSKPDRYPYSGIVVHTMDMFFKVNVVGRPTLKAMDDVAQLQWIPLADLQIEQFGLESVRAGLITYLKQAKV